MPLTKHVPSWYDDEVRALYDLAHGFFEREVVACVERWDAQRHIDRKVWLEAGKLGLLLCSIPAEYGGSRAQRDRAALHPQLRHGGVETAVAAPDGHR